jgi:DNA-binding IclR family transcriptional regulator
MLRLMAEYRDDDSDRVSVADLSRHLGLPVSLVRAALTRIVRQF